MNHDLKSWFAILHSRYRGILIWLMAAGLMGSALSFVQNEFLNLMTPALSATMEEVDPNFISNSSFGFLLQWGGFSGISLPILVLGLFVITRLVMMVVEYCHSRWSGILAIKSRNDIEAQVLSHILRKKDAFFNDHSPAEILNRLSLDVDRVIERRTNAMDVWWYAVVLLGNIVFFAGKDWRLAIVALLVAVSGALVTEKLIRPAKELDRDYLAQDDNLQSRFHDYIKAVPEIQTGFLYDRILEAVGRLQKKRTKVLIQYDKLQAATSANQSFWSLLALLTMFGIVLLQRRMDSNTSLALSLLPVVIYTIPTLFNNASNLIYLRFNFQLAQSSIQRLSEYESHFSDIPESPGLCSQTGAKSSLILADLVADNATYRYQSPDGCTEGGVTEISTVFSPGHWTAIVGATGSGKSTLVQLFLTRLTVQSGTMRYGDRNLANLSEMDKARIFSLMPQTPVLLDATIAENILFGCAKTDRPDSFLMELIEQSGLGDICRLKALEMFPGKRNEELIRTPIFDLRKQARRYIQDRCDVQTLAYEKDYFDKSHWVLELILRGRCNQRKTADKIFENPAGVILEKWIGTPFGQRLTLIGEQLLEENQNLFRLENYGAYCRLANAPVPEKIWRIRHETQIPKGKIRSKNPAVALLKIALTCAPVELGAMQAELAEQITQLRQSGEEFCKNLSTLCSDSFAPFDKEKIHPFLTWKENLSHGALPTTNFRTSGLVDQALVDFVRNHSGLRKRFTEVGLDFCIGKDGERLSGGQRQIVTLVRTLARNTPVIFLDEPTSALDPSSRAKVARLLKKFKVDRTIISISHDPEFVREADNVRLMHGGVLVENGTFDELADRSNMFRQTLRLK